MPSVVGQLLSVLTVLATLRSRVSSWFVGRVTREDPVHDIQVGSPVEFDDLTSDSNEREVQQQDHNYDRKKQNENEKKYTLGAEHDDPFSNDALESQFARSFGAVFGEGTSDAAGASSSDSRAESPSDQEVKANLPRAVAEAQELYKLYKMPPPCPPPTKENDAVNTKRNRELRMRMCIGVQENKLLGENLDGAHLIVLIFFFFFFNQDEESVSSLDSMDTPVTVTWREWIAELRKRMPPCHWRNPFRRQAKSGVNRNQPIGEEGSQVERVPSLADAALAKFIETLVMRNEPVEEPVKVRKT